MGAFIKLGDIKGEATDADHKGWILLDSASFAIGRSIPAGAKDNQRTKGETQLGDLACTRHLDQSSVKIQEACANGTFFPEVEVHLTSQVGNPMPIEQFTLSYTEIEWTYVLLDPKSGKAQGNVPGKFNPGAGKS